MNETARLFDVLSTGNSSNDISEFRQNLVHQIPTRAEDDRMSPWKRGFHHGRKGWRECGWTVRAGSCFMNAQAAFDQFGHDEFLATCLQSIRQLLLSRWK